MYLNKDEVCTLQLENGIVIDYIEDSFVIIVKDDVWTDFEVQAFKRNKLNIYFLYERVCAMFLLENVDSIDTSDCSFDIHDCEQAVNLLSTTQIDVEIYLIDAKNIIKAARRVSFDKQASRIIVDALQKQMDTPYDEEGFDHALAKLQGSYEPFEMENMALVKGSF